MGRNRPAIGLVMMWMSLAGCAGDGDSGGGTLDAARDVGAIDVVQPAADTSAPDTIEDGTPDRDTADTAGDAGPRYASAFTVVELGGQATAAFQLAVHACAGLSNRQLGGSVYIQQEAHDPEWLKELALQPADVVDAASFLDTCVTRFPTCVRYSYAEQQRLLPAVLTAASALGAVPLDVQSEAACADVVFDATVELATHDTPYLATKHVFERFVDQTTGLAMLNPGYDLHADDQSDPGLTRDMPPAMVDFVFSEKLFVVFLINGCGDPSPENELLGRIVNHGGWPTPLGVYGYNNSWLIAGYLWEAQTTCLDSRNMGAIPTETGNLSFFSTRRPPIEEPGELLQAPLEDIAYDPNTTYVAFVVGDGDNIRFIMTTRNVWLRQRIEGCKAPDSTCPPLTWSISPHLTWIAPDVLEWYYATTRQTGNDYFTLPPSGHLYAYPTSLAAADQDRFVAATERDARVLGIQATVHWDWFDTWEDAEASFLPKYATVDGPIRGLFPINVPYAFEMFKWWEPAPPHPPGRKPAGAAFLLRPVPGRPRLVAPVALKAGVGAQHPLLRRL